MDHPPTESLDLSIVVPAYNEEESVPLLHERIRAVVEPLGLTWEVVYVDDGSTDGTRAALRALQAADSHVVVAEQRRNSGKSLALNTGLPCARCDHHHWTPTCKTSRARFPTCWRSWTGLRRGERLEARAPGSALQARPSWIANHVTAWMTGLRLRDMNCGLKAYRAEAVRDCAPLWRSAPLHPHPGPLQRLPRHRVPVVHHKRRFNSKYGPGRLLRGGLDLLTVLFLNNFRATARCTSWRGGAANGLVVSGRAARQPAAHHADGAARPQSGAREGQHRRGEERSGDTP